MEDLEKYYPIKLNSDLEIVKRVKSKESLEGYTLYFITETEKKIIDAANLELNDKQIDFKIEDYDLISWALRVGKRLSTDSERSRTQAKALLWVNSKPGITKGRISRTFLELIVLAYESKVDNTIVWDEKKKYAFTRSIRKEEPFGRKKVNPLFEHLLIYKYKKKGQKRRDIEELKIPILFPADFLKDYKKDRDRGEHLERNDLIKIGLLTEEGKPTELCKVLIDVVERWWIVEKLLECPEYLNDFMREYKQKLSLELLLYIVTNSGYVLSFSELAAWYNLTEEKLRETIKELVVKSDIPINVGFDATEKKIFSKRKETGIIKIYSDDDLFRELLKDKRWYVATSIGVPSILKDDFRTKDREKILKLLKIENAIIIRAPSGFGKTGLLALVGYDLLREGHKIGIYTGGEIVGAYDRDMILLYDDIQKASKITINELIKLQARGFKIIATLSREYELIFTKLLSEVTSKGRGFFNYTHYDMDRIPKSDLEVLIRYLFSETKILSDPWALSILTGIIRDFPKHIASIAYITKKMKLPSLDAIDIPSVITEEIGRVLPEVFGYHDTKINSELAMLASIYNMNGTISEDHLIYLSDVIRRNLGTDKLFLYRSFLFTKKGYRYLTPQLLVLFNVIERYHLIDTSYLELSGLITKYENEILNQLIYTMKRYISKSRDWVIQATDNFLEAKTLKEKLSLFGYIYFVTSNVLAPEKIFERYYKKDFKELTIQKRLEFPITGVEFKEFVSQVNKTLTELTNLERFSEVTKIGEPIFNAIKELWNKKILQPFDPLNFAYILMIKNLSRAYLQIGQIKKANDILNYGITFGKKVSHFSGTALLLLDKGLVYSTMPAYYRDAIKVWSDGLKTTVRISTFDSTLLRVVLLNNLAKLYAQMGLVGNARQVTRNVISLLKKYNTIQKRKELIPTERDLERMFGVNKSMGWAYYTLLLCNLSETKLDESILMRHLDLAYEYFKRSNNRYMMAALEFLSPIIFLRLGKISKASQIVDELHKKAQDVVKYLTVSSQRHISEEDIQYLRWNTSLENFAYYYLTHYYIKENKRETIAYLRRKIDMEGLEDIKEIQSNSNGQQLSRFNQKLTYILWIAIAERQLGNLTSAQEKFGQILRYAFEKNDRLFFVVSCRELGLIYLEMKKYKIAAKYFLLSRIFWHPYLGSLDWFSEKYLKEALMKIGKNEITVGGFKAFLRNNKLFYWTDYTVAKEYFGFEKWSGFHKLFPEFDN